MLWSVPQPYHQPCKLMLFEKMRVMVSTYRANEWWGLVQTQAVSKVGRWLIIMSPSALFQKYASQDEPCIIQMPRLAHQVFPNQKQVLKDNSNTHNRNCLRATHLKSRSTFVPPNPIPAHLILLTLISLASNKSHSLI